MCIFFKRWFPDEAVYGTVLQLISKSKQMELQQTSTLNETNKSTQC